MNLFRQAGVKVPLPRIIHCLQNMIAIPGQGILVCQFKKEAIGKLAKLCTLPTWFILGLPPGQLNQKN